jgi:hypothetical protein
MTTSQIVVLAFIAGTVLYAFGPDVVRGIRRRVAAWWRPEPLAEWRYPGGDR